MDIATTFLQIVIVAIAVRGFATSVIYVMNENAYEKGVQDAQASTYRNSYRLKSNKDAYFQGRDEVALDRLNK